MKTSNEQDYELNKDIAEFIRKLSLLCHNKMNEALDEAGEIEARMRTAKSDEEKTALLELMSEDSGYCKALLEIEQFLADKLQKR